MSKKNNMTHSRKSSISGQLNNTIDLVEEKEGTLLTDFETYIKLKYKEQIQKKRLTIDNRLASENKTIDLNGPTFIRHNSSLDRTQNIIAKQTKSLCKIDFKELKYACSPINHKRTSIQTVLSKSSNGLKGFDINHSSTKASNLHVSGYLSPSHGNENYHHNSSIPSIFFSNLPDNYYLSGDNIITPCKTQNKVATIEDNMYLNNKKLENFDNTETTQSRTANSTPKRFGRTGLMNNFLIKISTNHHTSDDTMNSPENVMIKPCKFIPEWLRKHKEYISLYKTTKLEKRYAVSSIILKPINERSILDNQKVAIWLSKIELFKNLNQQDLITLGQRLKLKIINKGDILCYAGEIINCIYILYEGIFAIIIDGKKAGYFRPKEYIGKIQIDKEYSSPSTLKAMRDSLIFILNNEYHGEMFMPQLHIKSVDIYEFVKDLDFCKLFDEDKIKEFCKLLQIKKVYRNDILYDFGHKSEYMYIMLNGNLERHIYLEMSKDNKWPTGLRQWQISLIIKKFAVEVPIEYGVLFGAKEMLFGERRTEKVIVLQDSVILTMAKSDLLKSEQKFKELNQFLLRIVFNEKEMFIFMKYIEKTEARVANQIKDVIEKREIETKKNVKNLKSYQFIDYMHYLTECINS